MKSTAFGEFELLFMAHTLEHPRSTAYIKDSAQRLTGNSWHTAHCSRTATALYDEGYLFRIHDHDKRTPLYGATEEGKRAFAEALDYLVTRVHILKELVEGK